MASINREPVLWLFLLALAPFHNLNCVLSTEKNNKIKSFSNKLVPSRSFKIEKHLKIIKDSFSAKKIQFEDESWLHHSKSAPNFYF